MSRAASSVDLIVAVHRMDRPVGRAVSSILEDAPVDTRVIVVCHGLDAADVQQAIPQWCHPHVDLVEHHDGIPSPAGPFNAGLARASATYVGVMGSDDFTQPGAVRAWVDIAERTGATAVLARVEYQGGGLVRTPPTRPWRSSGLDAARDRLAYRTAPLGLLRRAVLDRLDLRFDPDLATGEDIGFTTRLWTCGEPVVFARRHPSYVVGTDAEVRVTFTSRQVSAELEGSTRLVSQPWFTELPERYRTAFVVKLIRIHLFSALLVRQDHSQWDSAERAAAAGCARTLVRAAPAALRCLSIAERRLLDAVLDVQVPTSLLCSYAVQRTRHGRWDTVITKDPRGLFARQGPLRLMVASALMR